MQRVGSLLLGGLFLMLVMALRPLPVATLQNTVSVKGQIDYIGEGVSYDVNIRLINDDGFYYINRGLENGLRMADLRFLQGSQVVLRYIKHFTPVDPKGKSRHVAELKLADRIVYSEIQ